MLRGVPEQNDDMLRARLADAEKQADCGEVDANDITAARSLPLKLDAAGAVLTSFGRMTGRSNRLGSITTMMSRVVQGRVD